MAETTIWVQIDRCFHKQILHSVGARVIAAAYRRSVRVSICRPEDNMVTTPSGEVDGFMWRSIRVKRIIFASQRRKHRGVRPRVTINSEILFHFGLFDFPPRSSMPKISDKASAIHDQSVVVQIEISKYFKS